MPVPIFRTLSGGSVVSVSDDEDKSRGRSLASLFSRKKAVGSTGAHSADSTSTSKQRSTSRGRSISPYSRLTRKRRSSSARSPSPVKGFPQDEDVEEEEDLADTDSERAGPSAADSEQPKQENVTPDNAFDSTDETDNDGDEDEDDDGWGEVDVNPDEIELFRNTSANTGDFPVMNILEHQSHLPPVEDDHPNMLAGEREIFFVPPEDQQVPLDKKPSRKPKKALEMRISEPLYERNRCTINVEHGDP